MGKLSRYNCTRKPFTALGEMCMAPLTSEAFREFKGWERGVSYGLGVDDGLYSICSNLFLVPTSHDLKSRVFTLSSPLNFRRFSNSLSSKLDRRIR